MNFDPSSKRRLKVQVWVYWLPQFKGSERLSDLKILLLRTRPDRGSFWQPVTGGVEPGETVDEAALREALEETGFPHPDSFFALGEPFEFESRFGPALEYPFGFELNQSNLGPPQVQLDTREHDHYEWLSPAQALERIQFPSQVELLQSLIERLNQKKENH